MAPSTSASCVSVLSARPTGRHRSADRGVPEHPACQASGVLPVCRAGRVTEERPPHGLQLPLDGHGPSAALRPTSRPIEAVGQLVCLQFGSAIYHAVSSGSRPLCGSFGGCAAGLFCIAWASAISVSSPNALVRACRWARREERHRLLGPWTCVHDAHASHRRSTACRHSRRADWWVR